MNINQKIRRAIQKGLNEALSNLSIDDFDDVEMPSAESNYEDVNAVDTEFEILAWKSKKMLIDKFVKKYEINETAEVEELKLFINSHPDVNVGIIKAVNKDHLKNLIEDGIEFLGNESNLNWIDTSNVKDMSGMFENSHQFNGDISKWDVSNVKDMSYMFWKSQFNGDISTWDVSNVTNMYEMFRSSKFNGDISNWDVSNVTDMGWMFSNTVFNKDISKWVVSNVKNMNRMFCESQFNGDISNWDVSNITSMSFMFCESQFNGDISNWDVSSVTDMTSMFYNSQFNRDISNWDVSNATMYSGEMFNCCPIKEKYKPKFSKQWI